MRKFPIAIFTLVILLSQRIAAQVACPTTNPIVVTRITGGAGTNGSLPWALNCLNNVSALNTVQFNITGAGPHVIQPTTNATFPIITKANAHIDGSTDNIIIDGSLGQGQSITINGNNSKVNGLTFRNFSATNSPNGLVLNTGNGHEVNSCQFFDNQTGISIARSVGTFNLNSNYIGVDKSGSNFSNSAAGISVETFAGAGVTPNGTISNNTIGFNAVGIQVGGARNVNISQNSIFCNSKSGIERNSTITAPTISSATTRQITGTAPAGSTVQVFRSDNTGCTTAPCQGKFFLGSVTTNSFGAWNLSISSGLSANQLVTATMTLSANTSEFSLCRTAVDVCANFAASIKSNNVTCNGGNNGSASVSTSGGLNQGIQFRWSTGATTSAINNLRAGVYTVTATDAASCRDVQSVSITEPSAIVIRPTLTNVLCNGDKSGQIIATVTGGTAPYRYAWSNGATTSAISNLIAGNYTLTVTDQQNCTQTSSSTLTQPTALLIRLGGNDTLCPGAKNGNVLATVSGGVPAYNYVWSTGATSSTITNLGPGNYSVTASDQNRCTRSASISVIETAPLRIDSNLVRPKCNGSADGEINIKISGGTAPYRYLWENGATTINRTGLKAGEYKVGVTDANACTETWVFTLREPPPIRGQVSSTEPTCFGQTNGTAKMEINDPGPHTYLWSTGATTSAIANLGAGAYRVSVSNANNCQTVFPFTINAPPSGIAVQTRVVDINCFGQNTGQVSTNTTGGRPPYTYLWSNGATTANLANLPASLYRLTVSDQTGCGDTASANVRQNPALTPVFSPLNPACFGQTNGQVSVSVTGGSPPYSYAWSNGATSTAITGLAAGKYVLTVTDALGCSKRDSVQLSAPTQLQATTSVTNVNCNGSATGTAQATASGGTAPYTYAWSNGASTSAITNLLANTYSLTLTDSRLCTTTNSATVSQPAALLLVLTTFDVPCNETNTGRATTQVSGGSPPYRYAWSNGATSSALSNLAPGSYSVTVTDAAGCVVNDSKRVNSAARINPQINATPILCNGQSNGQASVIVTGTGTYTYAWSNGASTSAITNLAAGAYTVTVSAAGGCRETASTTITVPAALAINVTTVNLRCAGQNEGQASASVSGGVAPYAYRWSNGATTSSISALAAGNYSLTVSDANQCTSTQNLSITAPSALQVNVTFTRETSPNARNGTGTATASGGTTPYRYVWSNGATTSTITGLTQGAYTVTVTDANGCTLSRSGVVNGESCAGISVSGVVNDLKCAGEETGSISLSVVGGTEPYFYAWNNGETTATLNNLNEGTYSVTVSDANGCTGNYSTTLLASSRQPKPLYGLVAPDTVCGNETFTLRADDLFPGPRVTYIWQLPTGEELRSSTASLKLKATSSAYTGEYMALRDSAGCRSSIFGPVIVDVISLPPNSLSAGRDTTLCQGTSVTLRGRAPLNGRASWLALSSKVTIQNPNSAVTTAQNLSIGNNRFVWRVAIGKCLQAAADTVKVFLEKAPQAKDDKYTIERAQDIAAMNVLLNDDLAGVQDTVVAWTSAPTLGSFEFVEATKSFRYTAEADFRGVIRFQYIVCNEASLCATPCDSATVSIDVFNLPKPTEGLVLDDAGPNGTLQIRGLQGYSKVDIVITNRWGDIVYRNDNYDNNAPWRGRSGDNGLFLPPGAYYYVLRAYDNGELVGKPVTGAIYLFKKDNP